MENKEINQKILEIWKKYPKESGDLYPLLYPEFKKNTVLFIGLNPSFSLHNNKIGKIVDGCKTPLKNKISKKSFEKKNGFKEFEFQNLIEFEKCSKENYRYFGKHREIAKELGFKNWEHIDLFFYRVTSQKTFKEEVIKYKEKKGFLFNDFGKEQLEISLEIIKKCNPKIIVVTNAFSSDIINSHKIFKNKVNKEEFEMKGYDYFEINNKKIPIFFSSMISGQRALDNHSFRRLKFDIQRCLRLEKIN